jgi:hypothetical protein
VHKLRPLLLFPLVLAAVLLPGSGHAADPVLMATVGPAFSITLKTPNGLLVRRILPGTYTIKVRDLSTLHSFHLVGPGGIDMATDILATDSPTWTVTFVDGKYRYMCDAHPTTMKRTFSVGPPLPKLNGRVGPGKVISLKTPSGTLVKSLAAGEYDLTVKDATKADNFHLFGAGVNMKTGRAFRGSQLWDVTFKAGKTYTIRSDAHPKLRRTFKVTAKVPPPPPPPIPA